MSVVNTIRGPIDSADLGRTLSHEHLTAGGAAMERVPGVFDLDEAVRRDMVALGRARAAGVQAMIDLTPFDLGRQMPLFERVAEADPGVHVVCATGVYRWVPFYLFRRDIDEVAEILLHDIEKGIDGTGIRAGIIKLAWDFEYRLTHDDPAIAAGMPRAGLERTARAAARAARAGGVPISCHTNAADRLGLPLMDIFEDEGIDPAAVTIGHTNDSHDMDYVTGIAARGFNVGLDRFSAARGEEEIARRSRIALDLAKAGYAGQTSLSHDASPYYRFTSDMPDMPDCWTAVNTVEVPWLLANGATQAEVDAMQIGSIRRTFEAAAAMRG